MKSPLPLLTGLFVVASGVAVGRNLLTTKVKTSSKGPIEAVLPASLKVVDPPDPQGQARYERLIAIVDRFSDGDLSLSSKAEPTAFEKPKAVEARERIVETFGSLDALLNEGGLRTLPRTPGMLLPQLSKIKGLSKTLAICAGEAAKRGDQKESARCVCLNLRLGQALVESKGVLIDELVAIACQAIANRSAYEVEMMGGLDAAGRARVLALMPPLDGTMPELSQALRRDFQISMMPLLVGPPDGIRAAYRMQGVGSGLAQGTFDAVETARLLGRIEAARMEDLGQPFPLQTKRATKIAEEATADLPHGEGLSDIPDGLQAIWLKFKYRMAMNSGSNTIGRELASGAAFELGATAARRAASRNLVRSVLLLRHGGQPNLADPFGEGPLQIDAKRKIVWSVSENGRNDHGEIGKTGAPSELDYGFAYGEGAWKPGASPKTLSGRPRPLPAGPGKSLRSD